jgi:hypothetical protein
LLHLHAFGRDYGRLHGFGHDVILFVNADDAMPALSR